LLLREERTGGKEETPRKLTHTYVTDMAVIKKILFPFFRDRHRFLMAKWWFRFLVVGYVVALAIAPSFLFTTFLDSGVEWCWRTASAYSDDAPKYKQQLEECSRIHRAVLPFIVIETLLVALLGHYIVQVVFFKIGVDFVTLGPSRSQ
jgi:hypothetical protein